MGNLSDLGDSELQEELLNCGYTQHVTQLFNKLFPDKVKEIPESPLESMRLVIIDFRDWKIPGVSK